MIAGAWTVDAWTLVEVEFTDQLPAVVLIQTKEGKSFIVPTAVWSGYTKQWKSAPCIRKYITNNSSKVPLALLTALSLSLSHFNNLKSYMKELKSNYTGCHQINATLDKSGYCVLNASSVIEWLSCSKEELLDLATTWNDLPNDNYLKDGGRYRYRRHGSFVFENNSLVKVPHRAHWQPIDYNALHGGIERWFEPIKDTTLKKTAWGKILIQFASTASSVQGDNQIKWCIEAHQFRIDTTDGIGRPTPEGAHRDGVDFVAVFMVNRKDIKGGETRVFDANGPSGERFTLDESWSLLLLDDKRVIHESTPIQPIKEAGYRDTLVVTLRRNFFQDLIKS